MRIFFDLFVLQFSANKSKLGKAGFLIYFYLIESGGYVFCIFSYSIVFIIFRYIYIIQ